MFHPAMHATGGRVGAAMIRKRKKGRRAESINWPSRIGHLAEEKEDPRCKQVALKICKIALASNREARVVADPKRNGEI